VFCLLLPYRFAGRNDVPFMDLLISFSVIFFSFSWLSSLLLHQPETLSARFLGIAPVETANPIAGFNVFCDDFVIDD
jgi:hypothetical protein